MNDRDDFAELVGSARSVIKSSSLYFNGRIRYGTKGERVEERLLCMDAVRIYICSIKIPVKIESQFNILSIKIIERISDSHVLIETDEKQTHTLYGLHDKSSLEPFLIVLIRNLHAVFPHRLQAIVEIRPENESDKLLSLSNKYYPETNVCRPCGGYSLHYECACDFHEISMHKSVQIIIDTVFAHRISREFTFREFESIVQKDWLPIISALRYNDWFRKITIENIKLTLENIDELRTVIRLSNSIRELRLINCNLKHEFCTRFNHSLSLSHIENLDLSYNPLEDKGLIALSSSLQQRKLPLISINLQSCSLTHKSLYTFHTALVTNNNLLKNLQILNLSGNRIKEENCITILFENNENILEELHLSDIEFSLESFFHSLTTVSCKLRRLFISSTRTSIPSSHAGGVKLFFTKNQTLEILQLSNANLSNDFLRELCDGLHTNVHLNTLDLRLSGNELDVFIHEYGNKFASIPCLTALDITGCDIDSEMPNFLGELKKNRKLKILYIGKNFNNTKQRNIQKTINAMKDLVLDSNLEYLSIMDSKLKEYTGDFLFALMHNAPLKILDIRGNSMGETGSRIMSHVLQMNKNLHTIFLDRNLLGLSNFEEIVNAMEENSTIQYFPVPITDVIQMKITEKDRMEKVQTLITKLDSICAKNQQRKDNLSSNDSLIVTTNANLTREMNSSWEYQQQLIGDQASLDYILSCSNRPTHNTDLNSILTRTANITKISSQLYETYIQEEERLKIEWNEISQIFQQKFIENNERLSKKFYQLIKEQSMINYDDKFQEQIRTFFSNSNDNIDQLLHKEIPNKFLTSSRQCYMNVATCLQKRAYDTTNDMASDMHKQLETTIFHTRIPQQKSTLTETQQHPRSSSTLDRTNKNDNITTRSSLKHNRSLQIDLNDDMSTNRQGKQFDSNESIQDPSPKSLRTSNRTIFDKDQRVLSTKDSIPTSPKLDLHKPILNNNNERELSSDIDDPIYGNIQIGQHIKKEDISMENEGDLIENDLLNLVQEEQKKDLPPALPIKRRSATTSAILTTHESHTNINTTTTTNNNNLDVNIEPTMKLIHPSKDRPRRANIRPPNKRSGNNITTNDSSSDGSRLTDENDDISQSDIRPKLSSSIDSQINESPTTTMSKFIKSTSKPTKITIDESSSKTTTTPIKPPVPLPPVHPRPTSVYTMKRSMTVSNTESSDKPQLDSSNESFKTKPSMSTSLYSSSSSSSSVLPNNEQKDSNNSTNSVSSPPPVSARTGKAALGTRVLPVSNSHGGAPPVTLRNFQGERKAAFAIRSPSAEQPLTPDIISGGGGGSTAGSSTPSSPLNTVEFNEQYKQKSVKERTQMLATAMPSVPSNDKKSNTTISSSETSSYTPRTYRRIIEQVNLFC